MSNYLYNCYSGATAAGERDASTICFVQSTSQRNPLCALVGRPPPTTLRLYIQVLNPVDEFRLKNSPNLNIIIESSVCQSDS